MIKLEDILKELEEIPPLPAAAFELLELTNDIHANAGKATSILGKDPALSLKVLKAANSCKYGYSRHIGTVSQAVVILGFKGLRSMILGLAIYKFLDKKSDPYCQHLWNHLLITACLSKMITTKLGQEDPELGFLCGLIHDIGKAVLINKEPEIYSQLTERSDLEHIPLYQVEQNILGFTHADLGREICRSWQLPGILVRNVSLHHNKFFSKVDPEEKNDLLQTVIVADNLAKLFSVCDKRVVSISPTTLHLFKHRGIDQQFLEECLQNLPEEISKLQDTYPGVFAVEPQPDIKVFIDLKDELQESLMRLFLVGKGYQLVSNKIHGELFVTDEEDKADLENHLFCDFFSNDTHYNDRVMFTNRLQEWISNNTKETKPA
jgi:putative nucleotidyltransferase with HDIG domain